jgi:hypothetical protein
LIVLARDLNYCWERFVFTKELMHLFDTDEEMTKTPDQFENLLTGLAQPTVEKPPQAVAEAKAFWMALACLCPEKDRVEYKAQIEKGHMDNYAVALQLRIPEQWVTALLHPEYTRALEFILR